MGTDKCDRLLYSMLYSPQSYETGFGSANLSAPERLDSEVVCNELGTQEIDDGGTLGASCAQAQACDYKPPDNSQRATQSSGSPQLT